MWSIDKSDFTSYYNNIQYSLSALNRRNFLEDGNSNLMALQHQLGTRPLGKISYVSSNRRKGNATN